MMPENKAQFGRFVEDQQVRWRHEHLPWIKASGDHRGQMHPWILPRVNWQEGLWPGIQGHHDQSLHSYLESSKIKKHGEVHNLKSSWALCANLYFPFRTDKSLLAAFLRQRFDSRISELSSIELEF